MRPDRRDLYRERTGDLRAANPAFRYRCEGMIRPIGGNAHPASEKETFRQIPAAIIEIKSGGCSAVKRKLADIKLLQKVCEKEDGIKLKLNWDVLGNREDDHPYDLLHYADGELIAFLGIYPFGNKAELCGMVHPAHRRKGIFSRLFSQAMAICEKEHFPKILLNAPAGSLSAKAFLQRVPCVYDSSEYQMKWVPRELSGFDGVLRPSVTEEDFQAEVKLDVQCFGFTEEEAVRYNREIREGTAQDFYVIEHENRIVGKVRVNHEGDEAWIYGFAIFPEWQGKGLGKSALKRLLAAERKKGYEIYLEVDKDNVPAIRLYESCGFRTYQVQDYYLYNPGR